MWTSITNATLEIAAYLAVPEGKGPFPAVLVLQEIFGLNEHIRETADKLAEAGFVALAPALFQRTAPGLDIGYGPEEVALGRSHKDKTTASQLLSDLDAALDFLQKRSDVGGGKFGAVGFCFGGHVAFLAATLPRIAATASFYGAGIATLTPGGGPPSLTRASEIRGEIELFYGKNDPLIPMAQVEKIEAELTKARVRHRVNVYEAGHGFFCDHRADFDPKSAADAWERTLQLFRKGLS